MPGLLHLFFETIPVTSDTYGREFDLLVTATDVENNRPYHSMILPAMKHFNKKDSTDATKIGDSIIDIEESKNTGCRLNISIATGAHTSKQLQSAKPGYLINNLFKFLPSLDAVNENL
ncbi:MAG: HAD hydrolase-like protein [Ginsengibacter sp.]